MVKYVYFSLSLPGKLLVLSVFTIVSENVPRVDSVLPDYGYKWSHIQGYYLLGNSPSIHILDVFLFILKPLKKLRYNSPTIKFTLLKCTFQWFLVYSQNVQTLLPSDSRTFFNHLRKQPHTY